MPPSQPPPHLELCVDTLASAHAALTHGASRLELCSALSLGGLTPSAALTTSVLSLSLPLRIPVHVLIRPRTGNFVYSPAELQVMLDDIRHFRRARVQGVVVGALTDRGTVDVAGLRLLVDAAKEVRDDAVPEIHVTFHRAFDYVADQRAALETLAGCGVDAVLTSGGAESLDAGAETVRELVALAEEMVVKGMGRRISVIGAAGVGVENAVALWKRTEVSWLHASLKRRCPELELRGREAGASMGAGDEVWGVRGEDVSAVVKALRDAAGV